ncbi:AbrB family transcriptional regulator [Aquabacterium lacunae]|uniref:AbrB family transcriptional regulator n=1 Tax=Aquabacterium lacunae TaxID=2528630 RepID=A0A4Q9H2C4_9BURK|nr:AbrB family transcriptional regulator [Aquabacterium lacunae]TBO29212.1 AbrB family transcriptional regulator [Aquabacterium lacunae]
MSTPHPPDHVQPLGWRVGCGWCVCVLAAWGWARFGGPLPFLLAPMLAFALARGLGWPLAEWRHGRALGQCVLGVGLGLRFTDEVVAGLLDRWPLIVGMAVLALLPTWIGYQAYRRWGRVSPVSACLCALPGGASEMAVLADRHGASASAVALTQGLRVTLVVSVVPWALMASGSLHPGVAVASVVPAGTPAGWAALPAAWHAGGPAWAFTLAWAALISLPTAWLHRRRWSNVWMMVPLLATAALMVVWEALPTGGLTGWLPPWAHRPMLMWPPGALEAAQLCLGMTLGGRLDRAAWQAAPRLTAVALGVVLASLLMCLGLAGVAAWALPGVPQAWLTHSLSLAPGGMAEMALLARQSGAWLPEVIATHVVRLGLVLWMAPWWVGWVQQRHARLSSDVTSPP